SGSSELVSPCFNFSSLAYPQISFKVFWESELKFDGVTLQYSTNNAASWNTLGTANSNDACLGIENWFNYLPVNFIGGQPGWSGNVQAGGGSCLSGQGSGQWLTARHNLSGLAGEPNVIFKFIFGAGIICNGYDGFAIDDIYIGETAANTGDFTYTCGAGNTTQFTNSGLPCQLAWAWNFGDPGSGINNSSVSENPTHTFSAPGTYPVSLTIDYSSGPRAIVPPKNITILDVTTAITNIKCNGEQNGAITVNVNPPGIYSYSWNTTPVQTTATISNLVANIPYTISITSTNACSVSVPVTLTEPAPVGINPVFSPAKCGNNNGTIAANATGGTAPYVYNWSNGFSTAVISNLPAGMYDVSVVDSRGCTAPGVNNIEIRAVVNNLNPFLGKDTTICPGQSLLLNPGSFASYTWQDNSVSSTYAVTKTGEYTVAVMDTDGCSGSASITVTVDCKGIYFPAAFTPNADALNATFGAIGDLASLKNFSIVIYNRYAQVIFISSDPYKKWDGTYKGSASDMGNYVWLATYTVRGQKPSFKKGTVLVIR
ncbi:MAG: gliding motility-associated C-terminal domain-containing protein, partial [Ferruginibacter sp.]|nr:gliding motility-associated C-terminal domain-containing protein [Ferruginibacter sp.]